MLAWANRREVARAAAVEAGFSPRDADTIAERCLPAARLVALPGRGAEIGASKLGGLPDLPPDVAWPRGAHGPMLFCGQVNTADAAFLYGIDSWQPGDRLLSFFADKEPDGWNIEAGRVLSLSARQLERSQRPTDLPSGSRFDEAAFQVIAVLSPPMEDLRDADLDHDLDADDWEAWDRLVEALGHGSPLPTAGHHQLFGNAWAIGDLDPVWAGAVKLMTEHEEDDASPYRLLAQFTSDQEANVEIADVGAIYFIIAAEHLATNRYDDIAIYVDTG